MSWRTICTVTGTLFACATLVAQQTTPAKPMPKAGDASGNAAKIRQAMSAAPSDISKNATIMAADEKGQMKTLRKGTNGWTCFPSSHGEATDPMCADATWMSWMDAYMSKKDPATKQMGIAYMLRGDTGASNTDPFAEKETPDNHWVVAPAHIMVLVPDAKMLDALPTDPHSGGAWVMWKGTKYAHLMVPTAPMAMAKK